LGVRPVPDASTYRFQKRMCAEWGPEIISFSRWFMKTSATIIERGPPIGRPSGNLYVVPLKEQIFCLTQCLMSFSNSFIVAEGMLQDERCSNMMDTARCTGMRVNMLTTSREINFELAGNLCVERDLASSAEFLTAC